jgi:hypothetical protein
VLNRGPRQKTDTHICKCTKEVSVTQMDETVSNMEITHRSEELHNEQTSKPKKLHIIGLTRPLKALKGKNDG